MSRESDPRAAVPAPGGAPPPPGQAPPRRSPRAAWLVALAALALRLALLGVLGDPTGFDTAARAPRGAAWDWGYEQGAVAQAVADGRGFADPFLRGSGATGWVTPLYPLLLAGLLELHGGVVRGAAVTLACLQAVAAALVSLGLWRLGRALASEAVGAAAAVLWALHPLAAYLPVHLVWDSTFVALALTWFLARVAEAGPLARPGAVAGHGALFGVVLLVNPAPLALAPALLWYWSRPRGRAEALRAGAAFALAAGAVVAPWCARNALRLGSPNLRTNLGVELFVGNNDHAQGPFYGPIHPAYDEAEYARYVELGEVPYAAHCRARAVEWVRAHPARFARLTLERVQRFWFGPSPFEPTRLGSGEERGRDWQGWVEWLTHAGVGMLGLAGALAFRGRPGGATLVRGALLLFPLVYYVTHVFERYRFPLEPVVVVAAASLLVQLRARALGGARATA